MSDISTIDATLHWEIDVHGSPREYVAKFGRIDNRDVVAIWRHDDAARIVYVPVEAMRVAVSSTWDMRVRDPRDVAAEWHGGQSSALYALASTGTVTPAAYRETMLCIDRDASDPSHIADLSRLALWIISELDLRPSDL